MSYSTTEGMTDYDRMLASKGWVKIGILEKKMLDEKKDESPLATLTNANIIYHTYEDKALQAEGLPIVVSLYVRTPQRERAQEIMRAFCHRHTM